ncbi:MAG TPA: hypothetical protein VHV10_10610 [Ktedonobacteraceae bacterium]|jgi:hypothetical protein|nr:hypothetical protein [Ktedonobacteraceae bacterium]
MNESLGANNVLDYTPAIGDIYLQEVQPDWFNIYCFQGTWNYLTALPKAEELIRSMYFLGENQGVQGTRRYYRVKLECAREPPSKPRTRTTKRQGSHHKGKGGKA